MNNHDSDGDYDDKEGGEVGREKGIVLKLSKTLCVGVGSPLAKNASEL